MLSSQNMIGSLVVRPNGELLGVVTDLVVEYQARRVLALRVDICRAGSCEADFPLDEMVVVPFEAVYDLQPKFVVITNRDDLVCMSKLPLVQATCAQSLTLGQAPLYDQQGGVLGRLEGLRFDADSGELLAFEMNAQGAEPCGRVVLSAAQVQCVEGALTVSPALASLFAEVVAPGERRFPGGTALPLA
ncbi:PRC-barrel domain-containing protein [Deinococcus peraridilitoris]|uniref:PRC-barrel domain-containing protein n=1 Tax=Deinococcus peraridilitoris (strain DSM 19664 / LMG 22246 / CIP 109416 / KR-200) TaxID=937777 RepID=K9ZZT3_DEIPD|nr:PRC-barrel domain-containing protein [Deinococcus peraridilitoris]AFZ66280.1 hypothetical protein Deipe_0701 [Deinococcus peraridilitoris DSM 19664]